MQAKARRDALRKLSNGVYVLTARAGERLGAATVTWVSQASFKPPLLVAAVRRQSKVFACLAESGVAALHVVALDQLALARNFFATTDAGDGTINGEPFADGSTRAPVLRNPPAHLECDVDRIVDIGGDHALVVLRVVDARCEGPFRPLTMADAPWEYGG